MSETTRNIAYQTDWISKYFSTNRIRWDQFYPSERAVLEAMAIGADSKVLDVGCGCGGLGLVLRDRFGVDSYEGIEINAAAVAAGRELNPRARIHEGDVLKISSEELTGKPFDLVFSLSCIDWNVQFEEMLAVVWSHVAPGGHLVATFRLTDKPGCSDFEKSYQFINAEGQMSGERAAYVVSNAAELWRQFQALGADRLLARGYWGKPSATAVTPYDRLCFTAVALHKPVACDNPQAMEMEQDLPAEILLSLGGIQ